MLTVLTVAAVAFIPGALTLRILRIPWPWALGLAPGLSLLISEAIATVAYLVGLPFNRVSAAVGLVIVLALAALARLVVPATPHFVALKRWTYVPIALGVVLLALPLIWGMGSLSTLLQQWDGVFHLSSIRAIRDNETASSLWSLAPLYQQGGSPRYYPSAFNGLISLAYGEGVEVLNASIYVFGVAVWASGMLLLAWQIESRLGETLRIRPGMLTAWILPVSAAFVTVPAVLFPLLSALPYAAAAVILPGVIAGLADRRLTILCAAAVATFGMALAHPIAIASLAAVLGPITLAWLIHVVPKAWNSERSMLVRSGVVVGVLAAIGVGLVYWKLSASVRGFERGAGANPFGEFAAALIDYTSLWRANDWYLGGALLAIGTIAGLVFVFRRLPRWGAFGVTGALVLPLVIRAVARVDNVWLRTLATPWYSQAARIAPVITMVMALLVALAIAAILGVASWRRVGAVLVIAAVATGGFRIMPRIQLVEAAYQPGSIAYGTMADEDDLAVLRWLKKHGLPREGSIIGDPANGAAFAYGYSGVDSRVRQLTLAAQLPTVWTAIKDLAKRQEELCPDLRKQGIRYLYLDEDTKTQGAKVSIDFTGMYGVDTSGMTRVTKAGSVSVWELPDQCPRSPALAAADE